MALIEQSIGLKNKKKTKTDLIKEKSGHKTADTTENGWIIKNTVLLFKSMEITTVTKEAGCRISDMEKEQCGLTSEKENFGRNTLETGLETVKLAVEPNSSKTGTDMTEPGSKTSLMEKVV